jgi:hypothetical protein
VAFASRNKPYSATFSGFYNVTVYFLITMSAPVEPEAANATESSKKRGLDEITPEPLGDSQVCMVTNVRQLP